MQTPGKCMICRSFNIFIADIFIDKIYCFLSLSYFLSLLKIASAGRRAGGARRGGGCRLLNLNRMG